MKGKPAHVKVDRFGLKVECPWHTPLVTAEYQKGTLQPLTSWYEERQAFYDAHRECEKPKT